MLLESYFYQIPQNKRGVILAVIATVLAIVSLVWGLLLWGNISHESVAVLPTPSATPAPTVTVVPTPKATPAVKIVRVPGVSQTGKQGPKGNPGKPGSPAPAPVVIVTMPPVPVPQPDSCLDLSKLLSPGCKLL